MPRMNQEIQKSFRKIAEALIRALHAPDDSGKRDNRWRVTALAARAWKISHPDLPIVEDEDGVGKDVLLQMHVHQEQNTGKWLVVAQNKVIGPDTHSSPRALIVAKEDQPPNANWDFDGMGMAAANFFKSQYKGLVEKAQAMVGNLPPGGVNQPPAEAGPAASRRKRLAGEITRGS